MNAVEIEEAVTTLVEQPFDADAYPYAFLEAYGNKATTLKRLKSDKKGSTNASDLKDKGAVLQRNNIHILVCEAGQTAETLALLRESPTTTKAKAKFILTTDGQYLEAENLAEGESLACDYKDFPNHFSFFLSLAGISTVKQIRDSAFDIRATSRLNKLYVELLKQNPDWDTAERCHDMNHFMARLIFCFFAEDTDIFSESNIFTDTIAQISESSASNTHEVMSEVFRAMNTAREDREAAGIKSWANKFPYVNGGLFSGSCEVPKFSKIARSYLLHVGSLDWTQINPDIFGSMIQAVADDEERGSLGMHYTSVPNILKVLNPLFLDQLREQLAQAADNPRKLLNLRKRLSKIRVFDPACGSGNFLVIAYKQLRDIEAQINQQRGEADRPSDIPLTNFRGIELRDFPAEIARLALIIAEYQCDLQYRGKQLALAEFLPLDAQNWITCGNALRIDWLSICPPTGTTAQAVSDDVFQTPIEQPEIDFENEGGETFICGNPPYLGGKKQDKSQKQDMQLVFGKSFPSKNLDYISAFFEKASKIISHVEAVAFVSTSSINQGSHVPTLWPRLRHYGVQISFCYIPFRWANNAKNNAGVFVNIIGLTNGSNRDSYIYGETERRQVSYINSYLIPSKEIIVQKESSPISEISTIKTGNAAYDAKHLRLSEKETKEILSEESRAIKIIRPASGTTEFLNGKLSWCLWIDDSDLGLARSIPLVEKKLKAVEEYRKNGGEVARTLAKRPHQFRFRNVASNHQIIVPQVCVTNSGYLPVALLSSHVIVTHLAHVMFDSPYYNLSIINSRMHYAWASTLSGRHGNGIRYGTNLCWNTFPVPKLTEKNKADLTRCAEDILLAREAHFPATIADLYKPDAMPEDLRRAHECNDEVLERIYIGRRFKNDTERLEKLFELYTKMTGKQTHDESEEAPA